MAIPFTLYQRDCQTSRRATASTETIRAVVHGSSITVLGDLGDITLEQLDEAGCDRFATGPGGDAMGELSDARARRPPDVGLVGDGGGDDTG